VRQNLSRIHQVLIRIAESWEELLPSEVFYRCFGYLVNSVLSTMILDVQAMRDIAEKETHSLHNLFKIFFDLEAIFQNEKVSNGLPM